MVVGGSGLGKSTFINTLCGQSVIPKRELPDPAECHLFQTTKITPISVDIEEEGNKLQLTVVDTPGFGDNINNTSNFNDILTYIEKQFDEVLAEETKIKRNPRTQDSRIHALLYFISPTNHGLRELDLTCLTLFSKRVNVIPVIAKSDSMTPKELLMFKERVMEDIRASNIPIYDFPADEEDDLEVQEENQRLRNSLPFAMIASNELVDDPKTKTKLRARKYPWGTVFVENPLHSDYIRLRYVLLVSHVQDLKESTVSELYELYRSEKLSQVDGLAEKLQALNADVVEQVVN
ncbi:hypothetical protein HMI54_003215 [Coelomomyces lativittatus]|nr:hypothetical protein HMI54_003214 [Coelomomyces lativittatus]KAJ1508473.1 hypothetical protein HMI54_003215 [Coelomomyces lativittatus]